MGAEFNALVLAPASNTSAETIHPLGLSEQRKTLKQVSTPLSASQLIDHSTKDRLVGPVRPFLKARPSNISIDQAFDSQTTRRPSTRQAHVSIKPNAHADPMRATFDSIPVPSDIGETRLLIDNMEAWNARWAGLARAKRNITATYYIMHRDVFGMAYLGHLLKKQRDGVKVRLMIDGSGDAGGIKGFKATGRGQDYLQELVHAGGEATVYQPFHVALPRHIFSLIGRQSFAPEFMQRNFPSNSIIASNHDKMQVIDFDVPPSKDSNEHYVGAEVQTGGRNVSLNYFLDPDDYPGGFRDTDVSVRSSIAAQEAIKAFEVEEQLWTNFRVQPDIINVMDRTLELLGSYHLMDIWLKEFSLDPQTVNAIRRGDTQTQTRLTENLLNRALHKLQTEEKLGAPSVSERRKLFKLAKTLVGYPTLAGTGRNFDADAKYHADVETKIVDKTSSVGKGIDNLNETLVKLAAAAIKVKDPSKKRIVIENPYVVFSKTAVEAMKTAAAQGVEFLLVTNSAASSDSLLTQAWFVRDWPFLLHQIPTMKIMVFTGQHKMHAKVATLGTSVSIHSTYNVDYISERTNSEIAAVSYSKSLVRETLESVEKDLKNPENKVVEYRIERDALGRTIWDKENDRPKIAFGPENHLNGTKLWLVKALAWAVPAFEWLPQLKSLRDTEGKKEDAPISPLSE
ncbi:MAG: phospholipase D-like domain-containing protein [Myxococcota bacterium]